MSTTSTRWLTSAALLVGWALTAPVNAQRDPGAAAPPPQDHAAGAQPAPATPAPAAQGATRAKDAAPAPAAHSGPTHDEMLAMLATKEAEHRERSAKLARLRELAQAKGQTDRVAQIAELEHKDNARYDQMKEKARQVLGNDSFAKTEEQLAKGRRRAQQAEKAPPPGQANREAGKDATQERVQNQREKGAETPPPARATPPAQAPERPKPAAGETKPERAGGTPAPAPAPAAGERPKAAGTANPDRGATPAAGSRPKQAGDASSARAGNPGAHKGQHQKRNKPAGGQPAGQPAGGSQPAAPRSQS